MVDVLSLPQSQRLLLAELSGVARRYGTDGMRDAPRDVAVAAVRAVTDDPVLLGEGEEHQGSPQAGRAGPAPACWRPPAGIGRAGRPC